MTFNWKKSLIIVADIAIAAYLILAVTAWNKPAGKATVCSEVNIDFEDGTADGFLDAKAVKAILEKAKLYPLGRPMADISARNIEETLRGNAFIESAECHKTQSGHVCISLKQRTPVVHVMADNNDDYYVDSNGGIMPETRVAADIVIATGRISRTYARKRLAPVAKLIAEDKFWQSQTEQINVLEDGTMEMVPRVGEHIVYLGPPADIGKKLERLRKFYQYGLNQAGWNKYGYINMEFDNQIICKRK